jgi:hypothetical protein
MRIRIDWPPTKELMEMYATRSMQEIADVLKCSVSAVSGRFRAIGIQARSNRQANRRFWNYGRCKPATVRIKQ